LDLIPEPYDFNILCKKFEDRETGDVNYALFCQVIEQGMTDFATSLLRSTFF